FSRDGHLLATAGHDRTGAIWRLDGNRAFGDSLADHKAVATGVDVTPDGSVLVSGGDDGTVVARDLRNGATRSVRLDGGVRAVDVDGDRVVAGTDAGEVRVLT